MDNIGKLQFVIKGGKPWGFHLRSYSEKRSAVIVDHIDVGGKADLHGGLKVGDHIIKINDVLCLSLADALQLIDSAFRTLTVLVWRPNSSMQGMHSEGRAIESCNNIYANLSYYKMDTPINKMHSSKGIPEIKMHDIRYNNIPESKMHASNSKSTTEVKNFDSVYNNTPEARINGTKYNNNLEVKIYDPRYSSSPEINMHDPRYNDSRESKIHDARYSYCPEPKLHDSKYFSCSETKMHHPQYRSSDSKMCDSRYSFSSDQEIHDSKCYINSDMMHDPRYGQTSEVKIPDSAHHYNPESKISDPRYNNGLVKVNDPKFQKISETKLSNFRYSKSSETNAHDSRYINSPETRLHDSGYSSTPEGSVHNSKHFNFPQMKTYSAKYSNVIELGTHDSNYSNVSEKNIPLAKHSAVPEAVTHDLKYTSLPEVRVSESDYINITEMRMYNSVHVRESIPQTNVSFSNYVPNPSEVLVPSNVKQANVSPVLSPYQSSRQTESNFLTNSSYQAPSPNRASISYTNSSDHVSYTHRSLFTNSSLSSHSHQTTSLQYICEQYPLSEVFLNHKSDLKLQSLASHTKRLLKPTTSNNEIVLKSLSSKTEVPRETPVPKQNTQSQISDCCCMYPKCHNTMTDCKIHSPPERDLAVTQRQLHNASNDYVNVNFDLDSDSDYVNVNFDFRQKQKNKISPIFNSNLTQGQIEKSVFGINNEVQQPLSKQGFNKEIESMQEKQSASVMNCEYNQEQKHTTVSPIVLEPRQERLAKPSSAAHSRFSEPSLQAVGQSYKSLIKISENGFKNVDLKVFKPVEPSYASDLVPHNNPDVRKPNKDKKPNSAVTSVDQSKTDVLGNCTKIKKRSGISCFELLSPDCLSYNCSDKEKQRREDQKPTASEVADNQSEIHVSEVYSKIQNPSGISGFEIPPSDPLLLNNTNIMKQSRENQMSISTTVSKCQSKMNASENCAKLQNRLGNSGFKITSSEPLSYNSPYVGNQISFDELPTTATISKDQNKMNVSENYAKIQKRTGSSSFEILPSDLLPYNYPGVSKQNGFNTTSISTTVSACQSGMNVSEKSDKGQKRSENLGFETLPQNVASSLTMGFSHKLSQNQHIYNEVKVKEDIESPTSRTPQYIATLASNFLGALDGNKNALFAGPNKGSHVKISREATVVEIISSDASGFEGEEDEELCQIEENAKNNDLLLADDTPSYNPTPDFALPSPPMNKENEIFPTNEPLPSPPLFSPIMNEDDPIYENVEINNQAEEAVYANLEMLKIKCSLVNSATQTNIPLKKQPESSNFHAQKLTHCIAFLGTELYSSLVGDLKTESVQGIVQSELKELSVNRNAQKTQEKYSFERTTLSLPLTSAYFTTSEPKAKLLTRYISSLHENNFAVGSELLCKKDELITSINEKLEILRQEQVELQEEVSQNDDLGSSITKKLESVAKTNELEKFKTHVAELEKITNLMLSLSGRLARAENAILLMSVDTPAEERMVLEDKYSKLNQQYEEAKFLQRNIDKRNCQVSAILRKYLTEDEFADYDHFIKMKSKLLIDHKELDEKIKLGEEQLAALKASLNA